MDNIATRGRLYDQVYNKMTDLTFHSIVNRAFIGALPMKDDLTNTNLRELSRYSHAALEAAGGFELLEKSINEVDNPIKRGLLIDIRDICVESANEVASRISHLWYGTAKEDADVDNDDTLGSFSDDEKSDTTKDKDADTGVDTPDVEETDDNEGDTGIDDVKAPDDTEEPPVKPEVIRQGVAFKDLVADARMTDEEYARFANRIGKLDLPEISRLINNRVEQAMRAEKETYKMIDESQQRLKDAITDKAEDEGDTLTDDQVEEIKESMLEIPLKNIQAKEHVSVFSKMQAAAIESLLMSDKIDPNSANPDILTNVTINYTFDAFPKAPKPSLEQSLNAALNYQKAVECCCGGMDKKAIFKLGTALAAVIYTFCQTMYSLNMMKCDSSCAKAMCDKNGPMTDMGPENRSKLLNDNVAVALEEKAKNIRNMDTAPEVEVALGQLADIKGKLYKAKENGIEVSANVVESVDKIIVEAQNKKAELESSMGATAEEAVAYRRAERFFETDTCSVGNIVRAFRNTNLDSILFKCTEGASLIDVVGIKDGNNVKHTTVALESAYTVPTEKYLKMLVKSSKLNDAKFGDTSPAILANVSGHRTRIK